MTSSVTVPSHGTVHYSEAGQGRPVVFVHGLLVDGRLWRKVVPEVSQHARCIVPDLPLGAHVVPMNDGADLTPPGLARLIAGFIEALDLTDVVLVGNDTGGALSQITVANHPERIGALVLTNCDAYDNFLPPAFRPLQWSARVPGFWRAAGHLTRWAPLRRSPLGYGLLVTQPIPDELTGAWLTPLRVSAAVRRDLIAVLRGIHPRHTNAAIAGLRRFRGPVRLVWGREDRFFKPVFAERLAQEFADAQLTWVDGGRTFLSEDKPGAVVAAISGLVAENAVATSRA